MDCVNGHGRLMLSVTGLESERYECPVCGYFVNVELVEPEPVIEKPEGYWTRLWKAIIGG